MREWSLADFQDFSRLAKNPNVMRYINNGNYGMTIGFGSSSNASKGSKNNWDIAYGSSNFNKKRG